MIILVQYCSIFFFDDVEIFDTSCDPVILTDELSINHLLYADDVAILSLSSDGLQNSLDKLKLVKVYCDKSHLELNTTKTKIIVLADYLRDTDFLIMAKFWSK